jgi:hypothetical protein
MLQAREVELTARPLLQAGTAVKTLAMFQSRIVASTLVAIVSVPGFLIGQRLQHGDTNAALLLAPFVAAIVLVASAIMRQAD